MSFYVLIHVIQKYSFYLIPNRLHKCIGFFKFRTHANLLMRHIVGVYKNETHYSKAKSFFFVLSIFKRVSRITEYQ